MSTIGRQIGSFLILLFWAVSVWAVSVAQAARLPESPFVPGWEREISVVGPGNMIEKSVRIEIPEKYFLYKEKTYLDFTSLQGLRVESISYSPTHIKADPLTGKPTEIFEEVAEIVIRFFIPEGAEGGLKDISATLYYQGCTENLCLRPESLPLSWTFNVGGVFAPPEDSQSIPGWKFSDLVKSSDFNLALHYGRWVVYVLAFIGGVLTCFTPCVLPILPVVFLFMGIRPRAFGHNLQIAAVFSSGMVLTYAVLGLVAATAGLQLGFLFQNRFFLLALAVFFLLMALAMLGLFTIQLPRFLRDRVQQMGGKGLRGAFLVGISVGLLASPCVGPVLGGLLIYVSSTQDLMMSALLLLSFGLGMGVVVMIFGSFYGQLTSKLSAGWLLNGVKFVLGVALLLPAFYYGKIALTNITPPEKGRAGLSDYHSYWVTDVQEGLDIAKATGRPIVMDFGAEWCPPCREMDESTFKDQEVIRKMAEFVPIKVDATFASAKLDILLDRYHIVGWPTILFLSPEGHVYSDLSQVGRLLSPDELLKIMDQALSKTR